MWINALEKKADEMSEINGHLQVSQQSWHKYLVPNHSLYEENELNLILTLFLKQVLETGGK